MSGADFHAQQELEAELYQERCLLLDTVCRGNATIETARQLAQHLGMPDWMPIRKSPFRESSSPMWDGTCNPF